MKKFFSFQFQNSQKNTKKSESTKDELKVLIHYLLKKYSSPFDAIGLKAEDFIKDKENISEKFDCRSFQELKHYFLKCSSMTNKAQSLRILSTYLPLENQNSKLILQKKRTEYKYFSSQHKTIASDNFTELESSSYKIIIKKDINRTLSEWRIFQNQSIRKALTNILETYAARLDN